jgi:hypothetical protein
MKKLLILIIIVLIFLPPSSKSVIIDLSAEELEAFGIAGALVMLPISSEDPKPDPEPTPAEGCKCSNGKVSYDGGTSLTDCPCKDGIQACGCRYSASTAEPMEEPVASDRYPRVVLITQVSSCQPCQYVDRDVVTILKNKAHQKSGWVVGTTPDCSLQILDLDDPNSADEITRLGLDNLKGNLKWNGGVPVLFKINKGDVVTNRMSGQLSYKQFLNFAGATTQKK